MEIPIELKLRLHEMNRECVGGGTWSYDTFDYTEGEVTFIYRGCNKRFEMCDNCERNLDSYVEICKPHMKVMNMIISIEKLERIRDDFLDKAEEISKVLNVMKAQL